MAPDLTDLADHFAIDTDAVAEVASLAREEVAGCGAPADVGMAEAGTGPSIAAAANRAGERWRTTVVEAERRALDVCDAVDACVVTYVETDRGVEENLVRFPGDRPVAL